MSRWKRENAMVDQPCVDPTPASVTDTEERAIVLYEPTATTPFLKSPSSPEFSVVIKADLIPGLKGNRLQYIIIWFWIVFKFKIETCLLFAWLSIWMCITALELFPLVIVCANVFWCFIIIVAIYGCLGKLFPKHFQDKKKIKWVF